MSAEEFIDSNVFVYLFDEVNPEKYQRARELVGQSSDESQFRQLLCDSPDPPASSCIFLARSVIILES